VPTHPTPTPLSLALRYANWQAFHLLLEKGAILHTTWPLDDLLNTAAHFLQPRAVKILLAQGASATIKQYMHVALLGLLDKNASTASPFEDFKSILKMYMDAGLDINTTNTENQSLLHVAVACANEPYESALAQHLIGMGVDVYQPVYGAWDAFVLAAVHGKLSVLRILLAHAAKAPNLKHWIHGKLRVLVAHATKTLDSKQKIHLERLAHSDGDGDIEIVCASLACSNLIDSKDLKGLTPLQMAVQLGNVSTVSKLLSHSSNLHICDEYGWTVLHTATYRKDEAMVRLLLQAGSDVQATSLQWAYSWGRPSGLYLGGAWKGTLLHLATMLGQSAIAELLLQHGADIHADTGSHSHYMQGHGPTALQITLDTGAFYGARDNLGPEMLRTAEILVESGAKVEGVADHITLNDVPRFERFEGLWEKLRRGITGNGQSFTYTPVN
jgi:ankyrin repeat protein